MKKPGIEVTGEVDDALTAIRHNIYLITGRAGGALAEPANITVAYPSSGIDVAAAAGTKVATSVEFDQLVRKVADLERVLSALVSRLNTP